MREKALRYWPVGVIIAIGLAIVAWIGLTSGSVSGISWAGGAIGVLAGIAIAAISGREERANDAASRAKRKR